MKQIFIALLPILITSCSDDPKTQLAKCELAGRNIYHTYKEQTQDSAFEDYIYACMRAAGYEPDSDNSCQQNWSGAKFGCYKRSGFWNSL